MGENICGPTNKLKGVAQAAHGQLLPVEIAVKVPMAL
jgi:hypothetical protein